MSSHKRQDNSDGSTKSNGDSQSILRKRPRLSSVKDLEPDGVHMEPEVIQDNSQTTPLHTTFRPHFWPLPSYILGRGRVSNQDEQAYPAHSLSENLTSPFSPNSEPYSNLPLEQFDVIPGIPASIPLADDDENLLWRAEDAAFIKSPAGLDGTHWIGKRPLGFGYFGKAGLWERRDENNVLVQVLRHPRFLFLVKGLIEIKGGCDQREQHDFLGTMDWSSARGGQNDAENEENWLQGRTQVDRLQTIYACQKASDIHGILPTR